MASDQSLFSLMYTFDGLDGDELVLGVCRPGTQPLPQRPPVAIDASSACHRYEPLGGVLGRPDVGVLSQLLEAGEHDAAQAKAAQLLMQWLALPTTETLLQLILSNARRSLPITRDLAMERS